VLKFEHSDEIARNGLKPVDSDDDEKQDGAERGWQIELVESRRMSIEKKPSPLAGVCSGGADNGAQIELIESRRKSIGNKQAPFGGVESVGADRIELAESRRVSIENKLPQLAGVDSGVPVAELVKAVSTPFK